MRIAKLRHRLTIQSLILSDDGYGGSDEVVSDVATVWGSIDPVKGGEYYKAQQVNSEVTHKATIRYRSDITAAMRISFGGRTFEILAVMDPEERHEILELLCKEY